MAKLRLCFYPWSLKFRFQTLAESLTMESYLYRFVVAVFLIDPAAAADVGVVPLLSVTLELTEGACNLPARQFLVLIGRALIFDRFGTAEHLPAGCLPSPEAGGWLCQDLSLDFFDCLFYLGDILQSGYGS